MKQLRELLAGDDTVWVYLKNEEVCRQFYRQAKEEGFRFGYIPFEQWAFGFVVALHSDGTLAHLPLRIWTASFTNGKWNSTPGSHTPVDYSRFISGEDDYRCKDSYFSFV